MKKIMFNDEYGLTRAVLNGRKSQTRRISKEQTQIRHSVFYKSGFESIHGYEVKPPYDVGEVVAIAQNYKSINEFYEIAYKRHHSADGQLATEYNIPFKEIIKWFELRESLKNTAGWDNKMFVKANLMLHHIKITKIKFERLQDISDKDCLEEGVVQKFDADGIPRYYVSWCKHTWAYTTDSAKDAYHFLIDKVSSKGIWESNPYVWVYEFELVD
ncbi:hypothetical protein ACIXOD_11315 [Bacteroides fragilis]|jgi:hypothetical protein|nr:hypothetical protein NXW10_13280 [Bacteroides fragilis]